MLTILLWLWNDPKTLSVTYSYKHANRAARQIHENLTIPHRVVLLTDQPDENYDAIIEPMELWQDYKDLVSPRVPAEKPQCYVKLKAFSESVRPILGDRFVSIDLDCVVTGNLDDILSRTDDFIIWKRAPLERNCGAYQSSIWMLNTGTRQSVWDDFHGLPSLEALVGLPQADDFLLTEQGWILYKLGPDEATWNMADGIYDWRWLKQEKREQELPDNARLVFFPGKEKPWHARKRAEWIR